MVRSPGLSGHSWAGIETGPSFSGSAGRGSAKAPVGISASSAARGKMSVMCERMLPPALVRSCQDQLRKSAKPQRKQIGVFHHQAEPDRLPAELAHVRTVLPGHDMIDGVADDLGAVGERE